MAGYALFSLVAALCLATSIWAIADAATTSADAFRAARSSRKKWMMLLVFFTIAFDAIGVLLAIFYLVAIRPRVRSVGLR